MENLDNLFLEGRVTRSLRKRLTSVDSSDLPSVRPGTPQLVPINELNSPSVSARRGRRNSTNATPVKTPLKSVHHRAPHLGDHLEESSPLRRSTRRCSTSISIAEGEPQVVKSLSPQFDALPEEEEASNTTNQRGAVEKRVTRSQSKSPQNPTTEPTGKSETIIFSEIKSKRTHRPGPKSKAQNPLPKTEEIEVDSEVEVLNLEAEETLEEVKNKEAESKRVRKKRSSSIKTEVDESTLEDKIEATFIRKPTRGRNSRASSINTQTPCKNVGKISSAKVSKDTQEKDNTIEEANKTNIREEPENVIELQLKPDKPRRSLPQTSSPDSDKTAENSYRNQESIINVSSEKENEDVNKLSSAPTNRHSSVMITEVVKLETLTPQTLTELTQKSNTLSSSIKGSGNESTKSSKSVSFPNSDHEDLARSNYPKTPFAKKTSSCTQPEANKNNSLQTSLKGKKIFDFPDVDELAELNECVDSVIEDVAEVLKEVSKTPDKLILNTKMESSTPLLCNQKGPPAIATEEKGNEKEDYEENGHQKDDEEKGDQKEFEPKEKEKQHMLGKTELSQSLQKPTDKESDKSTIEDSDKTKSDSPKKSPSPKELLLKNSSENINENEMLEIKDEPIDNEDNSESDLNFATSLCSKTESDDPKKNASSGKANLENSKGNTNLNEVEELKGTTSKPLETLLSPVTSGLEKSTEYTNLNEIQDSKNNENDNETNSEGGRKFATSWSQGVTGVSKIGSKIDDIAEQQRAPLQPSEMISLANNGLVENEKSSTRLQSHATESDDRRENDEAEESFSSESEEESKGNPFILYEAVEIDDNYESGASMDSEERREMEENQIPVDGESIGSQSSNDSRDRVDNEEEEDGEQSSFIVQDSEEQSFLAESNDDGEYESAEDADGGESNHDENHELMSKTKNSINVNNKEYKRILQVASSDSDESDEIKNTKEIKKLSVGCDQAGTKNSKASSLGETLPLENKNTETDVQAPERQTKNMNDNVLDQKDEENPSNEANKNNKLDDEGTAGIDNDKGNSAILKANKNNKLEKDDEFGNDENTDGVDNENIEENSSAQSNSSNLQVEEYSSAENPIDKRQPDVSDKGDDFEGLNVTQKRFRKILDQSQRLNKTVHELETQLSSKESSSSKDDFPVAQTKTAISGRKAFSLGGSKCEQRAVLEKLMKCKDKQVATKNEHTECNPDLQPSDSHENLKSLRGQSLRKSKADSGNESLKKKPPLSTVDDQNEDINKYVEKYDEENEDSDQDMGYENDNRSKQMNADTERYTGNDIGPAEENSSQLPMKPSSGMNVSSSHIGEEKASKTVRVNMAHRSFTIDVSVTRETRAGTPEDKSTSSQSSLEHYNPKNRNENASSSDTDAAVFSSDEDEKLKQLEKQEKHSNLFTKLSRRHSLLNPVDAAREIRAKAEQDAETSKPKKRKTITSESSIDFKPSQSLINENASSSDTDAAEFSSDEDGKLKLSEKQEKHSNQFTKSSRRHSLLNPVDAAREIRAKAEQDAETSKPKKRKTITSESSIDFKPSQSLSNENASSSDTDAAEFSSDEDGKLKLLEKQEKHSNQFTKSSRRHSLLNPVDAAREIRAKAEQDAETSKPKKRKTITSESSIGFKPSQSLINENASSSDTDAAAFSSDEDEKLKQLEEQEKHLNQLIKSFRCHSLLNPLDAPQEIHAKAEQDAETSKPKKRKTITSESSIDFKPSQSLINENASSSDTDAAAFSSDEDEKLKQLEKQEKHLNQLTKSSRRHSLLNPVEALQEIRAKAEQDAEHQNIRTSGTSKPKKRKTITSESSIDFKPSQSLIEERNERKRQLADAEVRDTKRKRLSKSFCSVSSVAAEPDEVDYQPREKEEPSLENLTSQLKEAHKTYDNPKVKRLRHVLSSCDDIMESASRALQEDRSCIKGKVMSALKKMSKKERQERQPVPVESEEDLFNQRELKRKERAKAEVEKALKASAEIILKKPSKKAKPAISARSATDDPSDTDSQVPLKNKQKQSKKPTCTWWGSSTTPQESHPRIHKLKSSAGVVIEKPLKEKKKSHTEIQLPTGVVRVEPSTPRIKNLGFRESPMPPRSLGFKVRHILTAGQDAPPDMPQASRNKRKRRIEEPQFSLPKPQWTQSGVFMEEKLTPSIPVARSGSTQFLVRALHDSRKTKKTSTKVGSDANTPLTGNSALLFKKNALFRDDIPRETSREILLRKQRKNFYSQH